MLFRQSRFHVSNNNRLRFFVFSKVMHKSAVRFIAVNQFKISDIKLTKNRSMINIISPILLIFKLTQNRGVAILALRKAPSVCYMSLHNPGAHSTEMIISSSHYPHDI